MVAIYEVINATHSSTVVRRVVEFKHDHKFLEDDFGQGPGQRTMTAITIQKLERALGRAHTSTRLNSLRFVSHG